MEKEIPSPKKLYLGSDLYEDTLNTLHDDELFARCPHVDRVLKIGIAFSGKLMVCAFRENQIQNLKEKTDISICYGFEETKFLQLKPKN